MKHKIKLRMSPKNLGFTNMRQAAFLIFCWFILVFSSACKKDSNDADILRDWLNKCKDELKQATATAKPIKLPYAVPPRGNSQLSCVRSATDVDKTPRYWWCSNTEGKRLCDAYGCEWKDKLPEGHPFLTPAPVEVPESKP